MAMRMRSSFLIIAISFAIISTHVLAKTKEENEEASHERISRVLGRYTTRPGPMTCDEFPRVCRAEGSPGPDCCRRQCVNVMTDGLNCGQCGRRCQYGEACCSGECVSIMYDPRHCGGCQSRCNKGSLCSYGMCSYA